MTFALFKPLQPTATVPYPHPQVRVPEFDKSWAELATRPDRYVLVQPSEAKSSEEQSLVSRNFSNASAVALRSYSPYREKDAVLLIHDNGLKVEPSWDERIESSLQQLRHGTPYMILIRSAAERQITSGLAAYLIYRGVRAYGEIVVESPLPFHVLYRPFEDRFAIQSGNELFTYPGFFSV